VKKQIPDVVMVFLVPPSVEELERRLRDRLTEPEDQVTKRLVDAQSEFLHLPSYDYMVRNDSVGRAAEELRCIILAERARIRDQV
jgi:guanylate kinase